MEIYFFLHFLHLWNGKDENFNIVYNLTYLEVSLNIDQICTLL